MSDFIIEIQQVRIRRLELAYYVISWLSNGFDYSPFKQPNQFPPFKAAYESLIEYM